MYLNIDDKQLTLFPESDSGYAQVLNDSLCVAPISFVTLTNEILQIEKTGPGYFMTGLEVYSDLSESEEDLVESLVVKGGLSTIVGSSSVGKSMLARQFALSIANNDDTLLGFKINTECNNVVYCSTEDTKMFWKKKLTDYNEFGEKSSALSNLHLVFGSDDSHFKALE